MMFVFEDLLVNFTHDDDRFEDLILRSTLLVGLPKLLKYEIRLQPTASKQNRNPVWAPKTQSNMSQKEI